MLSSDAKKLSLIHSTRMVYQLFFSFSGASITSYYICIPLLSSDFPPTTTTPGDCSNVDKTQRGRIQ